MAHEVADLVRLAALHQHPVEHLLHGVPERLAPSMTDQMGYVVCQASAGQIRERLGDDGRVRGAVTSTCTTRAGRHHVHPMMMSYASTARTSRLASRAVQVAP